MVSDGQAAKIAVTGQPGAGLEAQLTAARVGPSMCQLPRGMHITWHVTYMQRTVADVSTPKVQVDDGVAGQLCELLCGSQQVVPVAAPTVSWRSAHVAQVCAVLRTCGKDRMGGMSRQRRHC
jgi:hypothetical protein